MWVSTLEIFSIASLTINLVVARFSAANNTPSFVLIPIEVDPS
jgi:hypothetical protein